MRSLVEKSGGNVVMCESFSESVFKESVRKAFANSAEADMIFAAELEVNTSRFFYLLRSKSLAYFFVFEIINSFQVSMIVFGDKFIGFLKKII